MQERFLHLKKTGPGPGTDQGKHDVTSSVHQCGTRMEKGSVGIFLITP